MNSVTVPTLGTVYGNTNFTVGSPAATATTMAVPVTSQAPLTTAYWMGGLSGASRVWAASNGASASNWATASGGAVQALVPGPNTSVVFNGTGYSNSANPSTLGADLSVNGLTFTDTGNAVVLNSDGYTLTIGSGGITNGTSGQNLNQNNYIYPNVVLSAPQTWTNYSTGQALYLYGQIANGGNLLTINPVGQAVNLYNGISGSGGLTKTGGSQVNLSGPNTYTGPTTILGGTLQLQTYGAISQSSAVTINNGASLLLVNANANDSLVNRVGNSAPFTVYGGSFQFDNSSGINLLYAQAIGPVALAGGQFDVILNNNQTCANNSQILTLGGLSQSGAAVVTFSAPAAGLNATTNVIQIGGATQTPAGQIIGPWATTGIANNQQTDYAVYNASGQIVPAGIAAFAEPTWTNPSNAYTESGGITLSATRTITALRDATAGSDTLNLGAYNLQTLGILFGGSNNQTLTINAAGGVLTQQGTAAANLYVAAGNGNVTVNAPIQDNTGPLTLVKSGYYNLTLAGANSYSGGTVLNAGTTYVNNANCAGLDDQPRHGDLRRRHAGQQQRGEPRLCQSVGLQRLWGL